DRISGMVTGPYPDSFGRLDTVPVVAIPVTKESVRFAGESWTANDCPIPLPAGVAPGSYRVVDDAGRVAHLEVAPSAAINQNASAPIANPEFYVLADGSSRGYFIRPREPVSLQP